MSQTKFQQWVSAHPVSNEMTWKQSFERQMDFIRDGLIVLFSWGLDYDSWIQVSDVIATHHSKSIELPVVRFSRADIGLDLVVRDNFSDWKLSVISEQPIDADFSGLFHTIPPEDPEYTGDPLSKAYFEGFPEELVFGYYEPSDKCRWSASISTNYVLYTTVFLILRSRGVIPPLRWATRKVQVAK